MYLENLVKEFLKDIFEKWKFVGMSNNGPIISLGYIINHINSNLRSFDKISKTEQENLVRVVLDNLKKDMQILKSYSFGKDRKIYGPKNEVFKNLI